MITRLLFSFTATALLIGCGGNDIFIKGRAEDPCLESYPACPPTGIAECRLDPRSYTERRFPGVFNFLVEADAGHEIEVIFFFAEQNNTGFVTQIVWNEPGCTDSYFYNSDGANLFAEAQDIGVISRTQEMQESGEHLIEIESDMQARAIITVDIIVPGFDR